jgi:hypothetical protein
LIDAGGGLALAQEPAEACARAGGRSGLPGNSGYATYVILRDQRLLAQPGARFDTELFERRIREYAISHPGEIRVLEAGCGWRWSLDLSGVAFRITGIDVSADAMRMRRTETGDLEAAIVGDLRVDQPPGRFL